MSAVSMEGTQTKPWRMSRSLLGREVREDVEWPERPCQLWGGRSESIAVESCT